MATDKRSQPLRKQRKHGENKITRSIKILGEGEREAGRTLEQILKRVPDVCCGLWGPLLELLLRQPEEEPAGGSKSCSVLIQLKPIFLPQHLQPPPHIVDSPMHGVCRKRAALAAKAHQNERGKANLAN